jgi:hypothetical protein
MNKYKIIFLDIDGVMNSDQYNRWKYRHHMKYKGYGSIDPRECHRMANFCTQYNIKLVISSSWRNGNSWKDTYDEFLREGIEELPYRHHGMKYLAPYIIGTTPYSKSRHRGTEIQYFIDIMNDHVNNIGEYKDYWKIHKEPFIIENYCIVDDDNDMLESQMNNFVQTDFLVGLTRKKYKEILNILKT